MKKYLFPVCYLLCIHAASSQGSEVFITRDLTPFCDPIKLSAEYKAGRAKFAVENSGIFFPEGFFHHLHDKDLLAGVGPIAIWLTAEDRAGNRYSAGIDANSGKSDFTPGPVPAWNEDFNQHCSNWNQLFRITKEEIKSHVFSFRNVDTYDCDKIPENVKYWPARNNPFWKEKFAFDLPDERLASFIDVDNDGNYNPCAGDYPGIHKSCEIVENFPNELWYWSINDVAGVHRFSGGDAMQIHINCYLFHYNNEKPVNDGVYFYFDVINQNESDLLNMAFGLQLTPGQDCKVDRYIGVDSLSGMVYYYHKQIHTGLDSFDNCISDDVFPYYYNLSSFPLNISYKKYARDASGKVIRNELGSPLLLDITDNEKIEEADTIVFVGLRSFQLFSTSDFETSSLKRYNLMHLLMNGFDLTGDELVYKDKRTNFMYHGDPGKQGSWNMLSEKINFNDSMTALAAAEKFFLQPKARKRFLFHLSPIHRRQANIDLSVAYQLQDEAFLQFEEGCIYIDDFLDPGANLISTYEENGNKLNFTINPFVNDLNIEKISEAAAIPEEILIVNENKYYLFEGYQVYQIKHPFMKIQDGFKEGDARLVYQCDVKNKFDKLYWYSSTDNLDPFDKVERIWNASLKVNGRNTGIERNFTLDVDHLGANGGVLVEGETYYYAIISYYANRWKPFDPYLETGQTKEYRRSHVQYHSITLPRKSGVKKVEAKCLDGKIQLFGDVEKLDQLKVWDIDGKQIWSGKPSETQLPLLSKPKLYLLSWTTETCGWQSQKLFCH